MSGRITWTPERNNELLLLVIRKHFSGTPDYDWIAEQMGGTRESVRQQFGILKRGCRTGESKGKERRSESPKKRKIVAVEKEEESDGDVKLECKT